MTFAAEVLPSSSFLEYCFLKYILGPATRPTIFPLVRPQFEATIGDHAYRIDYLFSGLELQLAIELDGYEFHSDKAAFSYDRLRQNDLQAQGYRILRFSYDNIRTQTARCIEQFQAVLPQDSSLAQHIETSVVVPIPEMDPSPLTALAPSPANISQRGIEDSDYFAKSRHNLNLKVLRSCQLDAMQALTNYFASSGQGGHAACVMAVGSGKTVLGIAATIAFARRRAMIVTPSNVIRGTFERALNSREFGSALHHLPSGPLLPGCRIPRVLVLDARGGPIRNVSREQLLKAEIIVTNYHVLGDGTDAGDLLAKLGEDDIDFLVIDEAHIAAAESYQRLFEYFRNARAILMSACFQRMDGKPIDADVVFRYRLIDAISDGVAKNLMVHRYVSDPDQSVYEVKYSEEEHLEVRGKDSILEIIKDASKLPIITAKSLEPIRRVMSIVRERIEFQAKLLDPIKPRVLFSALGEQHAAQVAQVAREFGIPCDYVYYKMGEGRIRKLRERFERESGDLQGLVHLQMLGEGYDFPPITIVVPMRPYGSFAEFYQFVGRGSRVLSISGLQTPPANQILDLVFHSELGLEGHLESLRLENDLDPWPMASYEIQESVSNSVETSEHSQEALPASPEVYVLTEQGASRSGILHTASQIEQRRQERERDGLAAAYARYVESSPTPIPFEQYLEIVRRMRHE
jgi:superfamily II DNA or RNA helicase